MISTLKTVAVLVLLAISTIAILRGILHHDGAKRYLRRRSQVMDGASADLHLGNSSGDAARGRGRGIGGEDVAMMDGGTSERALANGTSIGLPGGGMVSGLAFRARTPDAPAADEGVGQGNLNGSDGGKDHGDGDDDHDGDDGDDNGGNDTGLWAKNMRLMRQRHERDGKNESCSRGVQVQVHVMNLDHPRGGTFNETAPDKYLVLPIPPQEIMAEYGQAARIPAYEEALNGGWEKDASIGWGKKLKLEAWPAPMVTSRARANVNDGFLRHAKKGELSLAFEAMSSAGHKEGRGMQTKGVEPWPGMLVLRMAAFGRDTESVVTCETYYVGGCWKKFDKASVMLKQSYSTECVAGGGGGGGRRMYEHVLHIKTQKSMLYFYHFMTEFLPRVALISDFLKRNPHVMVHGWYTHNKPGHRSADFAAWGLGEGNIESILGITTDRIVLSGGCAEVLYVPETTRCEGLGAGMSHVTRAFIHNFLSSSLNPAPNKQPHTRYVLIIKRPVGRPRSISNFDDVLVAVGKVLSPGGVEAAVHTGGKLLDQLSHFGGALGVLGPHGAGLSLILAMEPGSAVIEYLPQKWNGEKGQNLASNLIPNICYLRLAALLGFEYRAVPVINGSFNLPLAVDAALGAETLRDALQSRGRIPIDSPERSHLSTGGSEQSHS